MRKGSRANEKFFVIGGRYRNRKGAYEVLDMDIESDNMLIRYDSGEEQTIRGLELQQRIVKNTRQDSERLLPYGPGDERNEEYIRSLGLLAKRGAFEAIVPQKSQEGFEQNYKDIKGTYPIPGSDMYYLHSDPNVDKWGVELRITFAASEATLADLEFGPGVRVVDSPQAGEHRINNNGLIWTLWEMGFCLGDEQNPDDIVDNIPLEYVEIFEKAVSSA